MRLFYRPAPARQEVEKKTAIRKKDPSLAAAEDGSSTTPKEEESKNVI
jgi:hypothetical protein